LSHPAAAARARRALLLPGGRRPGAGEAGESPSGNVSISPFGSASTIKDHVVMTAASAAVADAADGPLPATVPSLALLRAS